MADLLSRGELMALDVDQLVEKILGLRGDIAEDAEELAALRDQLSDVEEARDEAQAECTRLRRELAATEEELTKLRAAAREHDLAVVDAWATHEALDAFEDLPDEGSPERVDFDQAVTQSREARSKYLKVARALRALLPEAPYA